MTLRDPRPDQPSSSPPNLKGKLLLVHGDMDNNVHPGGTIRLVDALIKANKRFDMMIMPGQAHGFGHDAAVLQPHADGVLRRASDRRLLPGGLDHAWEVNRGRLRRSGVSDRLGNSASTTNAFKFRIRINSNSNSELVGKHDGLVQDSSLTSPPSLLIPNLNS